MNNVTETLRKLYKLAHDKHQCDLVRIVVDKTVLTNIVNLEVTLPRIGIVLSYAVDDKDWETPDNIIAFILNNIEEVLKQRGWHDDNNE